MPARNAEERGIREPGRAHGAVIILSITTVLTAWSGFQSSKWGEMSIAFSEASAARIEAARQQGTANERTAAHVGLWTRWVNARGEQNAELAQFLESRFPEPLATAQQDWLATDPLSNEDGSSPFDMPSYVLPEKAASAEADARPDQRFADALTNNQRRRQLHVADGALRRSAVLHRDVPAHA